MMAVTDEDLEAARQPQPADTTESTETTDTKNTKNGIKTEEGRNSTRYMGGGNFTVTVIEDKLYGVKHEQRQFLQA